MFALDIAVAFGNFRDVCLKVRFHRGHVANGKHELGCAELLSSYAMVRKAKSSNALGRASSANLEFFVSFMILNGASNSDSRGEDIIKYARNRQAMYNNRA